MRRREFITLLGGAAAAWPVVARAQQPAMPVIGFLSARSRADSAGLLVSFRKGLTEAGYVDGQNVQIEYRFAEGRYERLAGLAKELVGRQVVVIAAISGTPAALAAKAATTTIPIVFANGADPIASGLVTSLNRPGGNISGVTFLASETIPKRLEVLHELIPRAQVVGYLVNPVNPITEGEVKDTAAAARSRGLQLLVHSASAEGAIDEGFVTFMQRPVDALIIGNDTFLSSRKEQIFTRAAQHAIPTVYYEREFAVAGGLLSYGTDFADSYRQAGDYVARNPQGDETGRLAGTAADQIRTCHQPQNCKGARHRNSAYSARPRRRGDRMIERRAFITLLGGAAAAWPTCGAGAVQPGAAHRSLDECCCDRDSAAIVCGGIGPRAAPIRMDRRPKFPHRCSLERRRCSTARIYAAQLVGLMPDVILTASTTNLTIFQQATSTIPVVFVQVSDPVEQGFVASEAKPGGNLTGFSLFEFSIGANGSICSRRLLPDCPRRCRVQPQHLPQSKFFMRSVEAAASSLDVRAMVVPVRLQRRYRTRFQELCAAAERWADPSDPHLHALAYGTDCRSG